MKKKIGVLLIQGAVKANSSNDQEKFIKRINHLLLNYQVDPDFIHFELANWYGPTQVNQDILLSKFFSSEYKIRSKPLRRFVINLVSDLVAYIGEPNKVSTTYQHTHELIHQSFKNIENEVELGAPLIIIASSIGTEIISNYINDRQNTPEPDPFGETAMQRMETLTGIFMFGNNNPLYISAYDIDAVKPFQFPPDNLSPVLKDIAYWGNFYDKNDPLGYPLKVINLHYHTMVNEDVQTNVGGLLFSWNAASHLEYWKSRKIQKRIAIFLKKVLDSIS
jgi:hypothetical protein